MSRVLPAEVQALIPSSFQDETNYGMLESVDIDGGIAWPDRGG